MVMNIITKRIAKKEMAKQDKERGFEFYTAAVEAKKQQRTDAAIALFNQALELNSDDVNSLYGLGSLFYSKEEYLLAYVCLLRATHIEPSFNNLFDLGLSLRALCRYEDAIAIMQRTLRLEPNNPRLLMNIGRTHMDLLNFDAAIPFFNRAFFLDSSLSLAGFNESHCYLATGDFERGWPVYERRNLIASAVIRERFCGQPWRGQKLSVPLLVGYEQGNGDLLQFIRFANLARKRCSLLVVQAPDSLRELIESVPGVDMTVASNVQAQGYEYYVPVASLPGILCRHPLNNPLSFPYIKAPTSKLEEVAKIFSALGTKPRVGLVWAGNPGYGRDLVRSMKFAQLLPLLEVKDINFISLQYGERSKELASSGVGGLVFDASPYIKTYTETAALISNLDLLICCDTAITHLAGALGKPVWVLTERRADWRWMRGRDEYPLWYPTARVFRQHKQGVWKQSIDKVVEALKEERWKEQKLTRNRRPYWNEICFVGYQHYKSGELNKAIDLYALALNVNPNSVETLDRLAIALMEKKQYRTALACVRRAVAIRPDYLHIQNLGIGIRALCRHLSTVQGRYDAAINALKNARELAPTNDSIIYELGLTLKYNLRYDEAIECFQMVIRLGADESGLPTFDLATSYLSKGDFIRGWDTYGQRVRMTNYRKHKPPLPQPLWKGAKIDGEILLVAEQGMGDMIQLVRFAKRLRENCTRLVAEVPVAVQELFLTVPGVDATVPSEDINPTGYAAYIPYGSLPELFAFNPFKSTRVEFPYVGVSEARRKLAKRLLDAKIVGTGFRIGVVWAGSPTYQSDKTRSLSFKNYLPLLEIPEVVLVNLQYGKQRSNVHIKSCGVDGLVADMSSELNSFSDTAAFISNLDLVITCDTSVAHLAGAMNKPVWVLLRKESEWRWLTEREDSPWYPSMRLFRQERDRDWRHPIKKIMSIIKKNISSPTRTWLRN